MKVVHIQNSMSISGNAAYRLSCYMRKEGIDSLVLNISAGPVLPNVYTLTHSKTRRITAAINRINRYYKLRRKKQNTYFFTPLPIFGYGISSNKLLIEADVIYIHWIAGILSIQDIRDILNLGKPVIFFMHDMWDFTGGCHHSFTCYQYNTGCKNCEMFNNNSTPQRQICRLQQLFTNRHNIAFVSPSQWMSDCARKSITTQGCIVTTIPNLVDVNVFRPINREYAKIQLGLPTDKKIITFGCQLGTKNHYKGWVYLRDAINKINRKDIHIVVYGSDNNSGVSHEIDAPITFLGHINDELTLALVCNATDVYVSPSLAESFGLSFLENILCGTPVVGFNNTAIGEIIKHKINGYLAQNKDATDLAEGIKFLLDKSLDVKSSDYSPANVIHQHLHLIDTLMRECK